MLFVTEYFSVSTVLMARYVSCDILLVSAWKKYPSSGHKDSEYIPDW